jgi:hypothetical protein
MKFLAGILVGAIVTALFFEADRIVIAQKCPNGAVGQVINPDGTTYCSYITGRYKASVEWRKL